MPAKAFGVLVGLMLLAQVPDPATPPNAPKIKPTPDPAADVNLLNCQPARVAKSSDIIVNMNTANCVELQRLPGVDAAKARQIISKRPYTFLNDLVTKGIFSNEQLKGLQAQVTLTKASSPLTPEQTTFEKRAEPTAKP